MINSLETEGGALPTEAVLKPQIRVKIKARNGENNAAYM
jgi:hypothetical protein